MKTKPNRAIREVRRILDQTQGEFAAMLGVSRDAVASWELGRSRLSRTFARRIALATGAEEKGLLSGRTPVNAHTASRGPAPFTAETFAEHRKSHWGRTDEAAARQQARNCADALELLFLAAARSKAGSDARALPAVVDTFLGWCRETAEDFQLEPAIEELLGQRGYRQGLTKRYAEWRRMAKEDPAVCRTWGFKDDPEKGDDESLRLEAGLAPVWRPGYDMRRPRG